MRDITRQLGEPDDIPTCPLCDQPITEWEQYEVAQAHEFVTLVHSGCVNDVKQREHS